MTQSTYGKNVKKDFADSKTIFMIIVKMNS